MKFYIQYIMDGVGYAKEYEAATKEKAIAVCTEELNTVYPSSMHDILSVDPMPEEKTEKTEKKKKIVKES